MMATENLSVNTETRLINQRKKWEGTKIDVELFVLDTDVLGVIKAVLQARFNKYTMHTTSHEEKS